MMVDDRFSLSEAELTEFIICQSTVGVLGELADKMPASLLGIDTTPLSDAIDHITGLLSDAAQKLMDERKS